MATSVSSFDFPKKYEGEFELDFKVNNFITANVGSHLKYDDDIKITKKIDGVTTQISGAKVQWKQLLGVGVVYDF